jgi:hypothetical protein
MTDLGPYDSVNPDIFGGPDNPPRVGGSSTPAATYGPPYHLYSDHQNSKLGLAALITGLLGLGILPLILGIIGVRRCRRSGRPGYGMALSGLILGALSTFAWLLIAGGIFHITNNPVFRDRVYTYLDTVNVGDCSIITEDGVFAPIACTGSHDAEVVATNILPLGTFPGATALQGDAMRFCTDQFANYVGIPLAQSAFEMRFETPTPVQWNLGNRQIVCHAVSTPAAPLPSGSIQGSGH